MITLSDAIIQFLVGVAPAFITIFFVFVIFSWLKLLLDNLDGSKW